MPFAKTKVSIAVCFGLLTASCSTAPIVNWRYSTQSVAAPTGRATTCTVKDTMNSAKSMEDALCYLDTARSAYRTAVSDQMANEATLTNAIIGAGALTTILAASNVHRDAILGISFIGGTTYALGSTNLRRQRVLVYQAGVEALNCAHRAIIPFNVHPDDSKKISDAMSTLFTVRDDLAEMIAAKQRVYDELPDKAADSAVNLHNALGKAAVLRDAADGALKSGGDYLNTSGRVSQEVVAAVDRIDSAVVHALIDSTPDLSSVPKVISGLAGMIGSIAPGAGLEDFIAKGLTKVAGNAQALTKAGDVAQLAANELEALIRASKPAVSKLNNLISERVTAWPEDTFRDCGVTQVVAPFAVSPATLSFTGGVTERRLVDITGGVKPYTADIDGPVIDGVRVRLGRFENRAEISIDGAVVKTAQTFKVVIGDSAPSPRGLPIAVTIAAAPTVAASSPQNTASEPKKNKPGNDKKVPAPIDAAVAKLSELRTFTHAGQKFTITDTPRKGTSALIDVGINCPDNNATKYTRKALSDSLLAEAGLTEQPPKRTWNLQLKALGNCLAD